MVKFADYKLEQLRKIAFQYNEQLRIKDVSKSGKAELVKALEERLELSADGKKIRVKAQNIDNPEVTELATQVVKEVLKERPKEIVFYKSGVVEEGTVEPISETNLGKGYKNSVSMIDGKPEIKSVIYFEKEGMGWIETNREYFAKSIDELLARNAWNGIWMEQSGVKDGFAIYEGNIQTITLNSGYWIRVILDAFGKTVKDNKLPTIYVRFINTDTKIQQFLAIVTAETGWKEIVANVEAEPSVQMNEKTMRKILKKPLTETQIKAVEEAEAKKPEKKQGTKILKEQTKIDAEKQLVLQTKTTVEAPVRNLDMELETKVLPIFNPPKTAEDLAERADLTEDLASNNYKGTVNQTRGRNGYRPPLFFYKLGKVDLINYGKLFDGRSREKLTKWGWEKDEYYDQLANFYERSINLGRFYWKQRDDNPERFTTKPPLSVEKLQQLIKKAVALKAEIDEEVETERSVLINEKIIALPVIQSQIWSNVSEYYNRTLQRGTENHKDLHIIEDASVLIGLSMLYAGYDRYVENPLFSIWNNMDELEYSNGFIILINSSIKDKAPAPFLVLYMDTKRYFLQAIIRLVNGENPEAEINFITSNEKVVKRKKKDDEDYDRYDRLIKSRPVNYLKFIKVYGEDYEKDEAYLKAVRQIESGREGTDKEQLEVLYAQFYILRKKIGTVLSAEYRRVKLERATQTEAEAILAQEAEAKRIKAEEKKKRDEIRAEEKRKEKVANEIKKLETEKKDAQTNRGKGSLFGTAEEKANYKKQSDKMDMIDEKISALRKEEKARTEPAPKEAPKKVKLNILKPKPKVDEGSARPVSTEKEKYASAYAEAIGDIEFVMEEATNPKDKTDAQGLKKRLDEIWRNNWYKDEEERLKASLQKVVDEARALGVDVSQRL